MSRFRRTKKDVRSILLTENWQERLSELDEYPPSGLIPALLNLRLDKDESVRWRAVTVFGLTAARLAEASMERARTLMRTLMWYMNEESGNLGWAIPNFMGEAMVKNARIAKEFHKILASYIFCDEECDGNFIDHTELRRDALWGLARLAEKRPECVQHSERFLITALDETDPYNRAYAAWALGRINSTNAQEKLLALKDDSTEIRTFRKRKIVNITVGDLVQEALAALA